MGALWQYTWNTLTEVGIQWNTVGIQNKYFGQFQCMPPVDSYNATQCFMYRAPGSLGPFFEHDIPKLAKLAGLRGMGNHVRQVLKIGPQNGWSNKSNLAITPPKNVIETTINI
jgi:hypothetical protein